MKSLFDHLNSERVDTGRKKGRGFGSVVLIAMTARCGSTAICKALNLLGLGKPDHYNLLDGTDEIVNARRNKVRSANNKYKAKDIYEYLDRCHFNLMKTETLIFKSNFIDFRHFIDRKKVEVYFPNLRFIYIDRVDKLRQAFSLAKAAKSGVFHSTSGKGESSCVEVSEVEILRFWNALNIEDQMWKRYFMKRKICPHYLSYEDFLNNPESVVRSIYSEITGKSSAALEVQIPLRKFECRPEDEEIIDQIRMKFKG